MKKKLRIRTELFLLYLLIAVTVFLIGRRFLPELKNTIDIQIKEVFKSTLDMDISYNRSLLLPGKVALYNVKLRKEDSSGRIFFSRIPKIDISFRMLPLLKKKFSWERIELVNPYIFSSFPIPIDITLPGGKDGDVLLERKRIRVTNGNGEIEYNGKRYPVQEFGFYLKLEPGYFSGELKEGRAVVTGLAAIMDLKGEISRDENGNVAVSRLGFKYNDRLVTDGEIRFQKGKVTKFSARMDHVRPLERFEIFTLPREFNDYINLSRLELTGLVRGELNHTEQQFTVSGESLAGVLDWSGAWSLRGRFLERALRIDDFQWKAGALFFRTSLFLPEDGRNQGTLNLSGPLKSSRFGELNFDAWLRFRKESSEYTRMEGGSLINEWVFHNTILKNADLRLTADLVSPGEFRFKGQLRSGTLKHGHLPSLQVSFKCEGDQDRVQFPELIGTDAGISLRGVGFLNREVYRFKLLGAGKDARRLAHNFFPGSDLNEFEFSYQVYGSYEKGTDEFVLLSRGALLFGRSCRTARIEGKNLFLSTNSSRDLSVNVLGIGNDPQSFLDFLGVQGFWQGGQFIVRRGEIDVGNLSLVIAGPGKVDPGKGYADLRNVAVSFKRETLGEAPRLSFSWANNRYELGKSRVTGKYGTFFLSMSKQGDSLPVIKIESDDLDLKIIKLFKPELQNLSGKSSLNLEVRGYRPRGYIRIDNGVAEYAGEKVNVDIDGDVLDTRVVFRKFRIRKGGGVLNLKGEYSLEDTAAYRLAAELSRFDPSMINLFLGGKYFGSGNLSGAIAFERGSRGIENISGELSIDTETRVFTGPLGIRELELKLSRGKIKFDKGRVDISEIGGMLEGLPFEVSGQSRIGDTLDIDLQVKQQHFEKEGVEIFSRISGTAAGRLHVFGSKENPLFEGRVDINSAEFALSALKDPFTDGELHIFSDTAGKIQVFGEATFGGAPVSISGYMPDFKNLSFTVKGQSVFLEDFGLQGNISGEITYERSPAGQSINGRMRISDGMIFYPRKLDRKLPERERNIALNLVFFQEGKLILRTERWEQELQGGFKIVNTLDYPLLLARFVVTGGEFDLTPERSMKIVRGTISYPEDPSQRSVDILCSIRVRKTDIFLQLRGPLKEPNYVFYSDPELGREDIYSLLFFGRPERSVVFENLSDDITSGIGSTVPGISNVGQNISKAFGLDYLMVEPLVEKQETGEVEEAVVRMEKDIGPNIQASLRKGLEGKDSEYGLGLRLQKDLRLEGVKDSTGEYWMRFRLEF